MKNCIRDNLEFLADAKVLETGINKKEYQYLLLKISGKHYSSITIPFNFSSLKKRIIMMNKMKSKRINLLRFAFILPILFVALVSLRDKQKHSLSVKQVNSAPNLYRGSVTDFKPG